MDKREVTKYARDVNVGRIELNFRMRQKADQHRLKDRLQLLASSRPITVLGQEFWEHTLNELAQRFGFTLGKTG